MSSSPLGGIAYVDVNLGDVVLSLNLRVPALHRPRFRLHVGAPRRRTASVDHRSTSTFPCSRPKEVLITMDLQADKEVDISVEFADEVGNPVPAPSSAVVVFSVDDATIIDLTDHGDGTAVAGATGVLGAAMVHVEITGDFPTLTGDLSIVVIPGDAQRVTVVAGAPRERTPD